jgi:hypothetical protein
VAAYSPPPLYLSLHTADPTETGSHAHEVTGGGYARQPLAGVMGAADSTGFCVNTTQITFGPPRPTGAPSPISPSRTR